MGSSRESGAITVPKYTRSNSGKSFVDELHNGDLFPIQSAKGQIQ